MIDNKSYGEKIGAFFLDNIVMLIFLAFAVFGFAVSETFTPSSFANDMILGSKAQFRKSPT